MRPARLVAFLILSLITTGCVAGRNIDVPIAVDEENPGTVPASVEHADLIAPTGADLPASPKQAPPLPSTDAPPATDTPPPPTAAPAQDVFTFDPGAWAATTSALPSFRQKVVLGFVAGDTGLHSKVTYEGQVIVEPAALRSRLRIEGQGLAQVPAKQVELIWIGEKAWVKVGRQPWAQVPASAVQSQFAGSVVGAGDLLPFIGRATRLLPDETVNGIPCKHFVYDVSNLETEAVLTGAKGDIWVARDGGYVVRLTLNGQGTYYGTYSSSGTLDMIYDLYDVGGAMSIAPPY